MSIDAIALVRIPGWQPEPSLHAIALEDAFLVPTTTPFAAEPDELGLALRVRLGDALDRHDDPRGVFMIPDVAEPRATRYDGVVDEIGDAGVWGPKVPSGHVPARYAAGAPGSFEAMVGQIMGAMGEGTMEELQRAMLSGDAEAFERAGQRMQAALAQVGDPEEIARSLMASMGPAAGGLAGMPKLPLDVGAIDTNSPDFQALVAQAEADLARDPARRAALEAMIRDAGGEADEDEDEKKGGT